MLMPTKKLFFLIKLSPKYDGLLFSFTGGYLREAGTEPCSAFERLPVAACGCRE